ncbi:riboflavin synthase subunit alpha [Oceaniovalibus guishaninsula JLT2003]|uniref:Riboflavin synthase n=1 Tax=Oceaniovalibus guishaninsula JLT2003 TaxID=1231392 RepID=K2IA47_9RHOB|nr:riboflavin synthase [Oceaniovalibus guishaninsula]EKE45845.1 riboflavin synthase subunit alpha [Oceaniovalibus guishaninsula JLT2003]
MFTGLISDIGEVLEVGRKGDLRARIGCNYDVATIQRGASIACDGVCLTAIATGTDPRPWFDVEISAETVARTNIGQTGWVPGTRLNLERSLRVGDELGGHIVSGHVDGTAEVIEREEVDGSTRFTVAPPVALARFIAEKGSVALNGTSLTVNAVRDDPDGPSFDVNLIPHSKAVTTWGTVAVGDLLNIEVDTMARYVARLAQTL